MAKSMSIYHGLSDQELLMKLSKHFTVNVTKLQTSIHKQHESPKTETHGGQTSRSKPVRILLSAGQMDVAEECLGTVHCSGRLPFS